MLKWLKQKNRSLSLENAYEASMLKSLTPEIKIIFYIIFLHNYV
jgi:hypothetical protein